MSACFIKKYPIYKGRKRFPCYEEKQEYAKVDSKQAVRWDTAQEEIIVALCIIEEQYAAYQSTTHIREDTTQYANRQIGIYVVILVCRTLEKFV